MRLPAWLRYYVEKRNSFMGHLFAGMWVVWPVWAQTGHAWLGLIVVMVLGVGWEYGTYWLSEKAWKPDALDVVPFGLGGLISWLMIVWK